MIDAVDASVAAWLKRACPKGTGVTFEPPGDRPGTGAKTDVLHLFLADVRADLSGQGGDVVEVRDSSGRPVARQAPVQWYQLAYEITVTAASVHDEHRLLGTILTAGALGQMLPRDCQLGSLSDTELPVLLRVAPPTSERSFAESADKRRDRTTLDLVVTAPLVPSVPIEFGTPVSEVLLGVERLSADDADDGDNTGRAAERRTPMGDLPLRQRVGMPPHRIEEFAGTRDAGKEDSGRKNSPGRS
ncbi:MAG TPA: Pvc16 family protein [Mycobacteriales bacterium]|nr:Pvc16 family protein [Mycobacteriales bacterium]